MSKKIVKKSAPAPTPSASAAPAPKPKPSAPEPKTTTAKATPEPKTSKTPPAPSVNKGVTTGMRIMEYQDATLAKNHKTKLSDEAMAANWQTEFPKSRCRFTPEIVAGVRRLFNAGKHGSQKISAPDGGVKRYNADGEVIPEKRRAKAVKADATAAAA